MSSRNFDGGSGLVRVVEQVAAGLDLGDVLCPRSAGSSPPSGRRRRAGRASRFSDTRTSYQVGRPWMLDGKMLRGLTGTPMRRIARANSSLAEAEPEPLTLANLTTKSLTRLDALRSLRAHAAVHRLALVGRACAARHGPGVRHVEQELLHVPGAGRAALGAQAAVQADVLVLDHDAAGLQRAGDVEVLRQVARRRAAAASRRSASSPLAVKVMQSIGQMSTQASHSMHSLAVNTVCTSQFRQRCASCERELARSKPSSTSTLMFLQRDLGVARAAPCSARSGEIVVVVAPLVDAHLLRHQVHAAAAGARATSSPWQKLVDRDRRLVAVRDRPDDVLRAERRVAAEEHVAAASTACVTLSTTGMPHSSNSMPMSRSIHGKAFSWPTATSTSSHSKCTSGSPVGTSWRRPLASYSAATFSKRHAGQLAVRRA